MTGPFQSIMGNAHNSESSPAQEDDRNAFAEALAEDMWVEELIAISVSLKEPPFGMSELSASTKTDNLLKPCETKKGAGLTALPPQRKPLRGGVYSPNEVLALLNSHYFIGKSEQEVAIFRIKDDGSLLSIPLIL